VSTKQITPYEMIYTSPRIAIVVPCYNEASRLPVSDFVHAFEQFVHVSFCFVNDGSSDDTRHVLEDLVSDRNQACVLSLKSNRGKAEAVRIGIKHVLSWQSQVFVGYWDADMATPFAEIPRFIEVFSKRSSVQFICGSRVLRMGALIERFWYRHYAGRIFATAASLVLGIPIYDSQCGAKLIKAELAKSIFNEPFISRWLFDVELLARTIIALGEEQASQAIFELPLETWEDKGESKVTPYQYFMKAPYDLLRIFWHYRQIHKFWL
jgi:dolichyl-phosphate beta-glucosyltransferase